LCHQSKKNEFGGEVSPPCPVTGLEDVRATPRSPPATPPRGFVAGPLLQPVWHGAGSVAEAEMEVGGEAALAEGNGAGGEADGGGRRRGTRREEMPADVALSVHIISQYRSTCATSNENHQNQVHVLKVNGFGSWSTDPRRFCSLGLKLDQHNS